MNRFNAVTVARFPFVLGISNERIFVFAPVSLLCRRRYGVVLFLSVIV